MRVAIYCRLSEEDRKKQCTTDDSESIRNQKSMLQGYAREQGWEIYRIYSDDDYTGADRNRPEFLRLIEDARERRFDIVLCKTQSRFTRELELVEKYIHGLFPLWGIRFVSIVDNADTASKGNKKSRQINGLVNEWYLEDMSESIKSVLDDKRMRGIHIGAFALYGYRKDPEQKGHLLIDEEAAAVVREVFTLYAQGFGKTAIARMLNDRGIPNPTEYKRIHGLRYHQPKGTCGTLWKYFAIADMLQNEMYIGNMVQGRYKSISYKSQKNVPCPKEEWIRVEGTHEPIIEKELWERVQARLQERARPFSDGKIGLFAGKVLCAGCGYVMRSTKTRDRKYLQCPSRHVSKDACEGAFLSVERLEQALLGELEHLTGRYLDRDALESSVHFEQTEAGREEERLKAAIARYEKKAEECEKMLRELYRDKVRGIVTERDYIAFSEAFTKERERLEQAAAQAGQRLCRWKEQMLKKADPGRRTDAYLHPEHLSRGMIELFIDHITVGRRVPGTREVPVEIYWNF